MSTQNNLNYFTKRKIPNIKSNFFKNLIENIPKKKDLKDRGIVRLCYFFIKHLLLIRSSVF